MSLFPCKYCGEWYMNGGHGDTPELCPDKPKGETMLKASTVRAIEDMTESDTAQLAADIENLLSACAIAERQGLGWRGNLAGAAEVLAADVGLDYADL